jgi:hypothetical protein
MMGDEYMFMLISQIFLAASLLASNMFDRAACIILGAIWFVGFVYISIHEGRFK